MRRRGGRRRALRLRRAAGRILPLRRRSRGTVHLWLNLLRGVIALRLLVLVSRLVAPMTARAALGTGGRRGRGAAGAAGGSRGVTRLRLVRRR